MISWETIAAKLSFIQNAALGCLQNNLLYLRKKYSTKSLNSAIEDEFGVQEVFRSNDGIIYIDKSVAPND